MQPAVTPCRLIGFNCCKAGHYAAANSIKPCFTTLLAVDAARDSVSEIWIMAGDTIAHGWISGRLLVLLQSTGTQRSLECHLTLFIEVEVLEALVEVAGGVYSSDVGVGVNWSQARNGRAVPHWGLAALLWRKTRRQQVLNVASQGELEAWHAHLTSSLWRLFSKSSPLPAVLAGDWTG